MLRKYETCKNEFDGDMLRVLPFHPIHFDIFAEMAFMHSVEKMQSSPDALLEFAIRAALKAGKEILNVYNSDFSVEQKADASPLTLADKKAHEAIMQGLEITEIPVLSEEGKEIPYSERGKWSLLWIVDPLDGTKEFVKRNGEFTVNIALIEDGMPILGVIFTPVTNDLYFGSKNRGAYKYSGIIDFSFEDIGSLIHKSEKLPLKHVQRKFTVIASRSHMTEETVRFVEDLKKKYAEVEIISAGSSLKICKVAEGSADCYPRFGPTMEWDTAAGQAIVENAGRKFIDVKTNRPMLYNRENLRNNSFIVQ